MKTPLIVIIAVVILGTLTACKTQETLTVENISEGAEAAAENFQPTAIPTSTPEPPRVLTICSQEPASLFLYGDTGSAARSVLQAIYDGPVDMINFNLEPVILERIPSIENGDAWLQPVEVAQGELIVDAHGNWVSLAEGVDYRPSGCTDKDCSQIYQGQNPVQMDLLVVQFRLLPELVWSDGGTLTASDSIFSFEVFKKLFQAVAPDVLRFTRSYQALDDRTVEWMGIPGYVGALATKFFTPLPEHQLNLLEDQDLFSSLVSSRTPIGWGPYSIEEWVAGDHITLRRNPYYFRTSESLPHFDYLVYRFVEDGAEAIDALIIGECDFIDRTVLNEKHLPRLLQEQEAGKITLSVQTGTAWELAAFGIDTRQEQRPDLFASSAVRKAIAMCIDRQKIVAEYLFGIPPVSDSYLPLDHPLYQPGTGYGFDPARAAEILASEGWVDHDGDPQTPRTSSGIPGIAEETPLRFSYLVPADGERPAAAEVIQDGMRQCGIDMEVSMLEWEDLMSPGPEGPLFGRQFDMAQFAWMTTIEPACYLFMSDEIPGPYPEFAKGWGGANLSGYSSSAFDTACRQAMSAVPGSESNIQAHQEAQAIFSDDLPVVPLYQRIQFVALRPDMCNVVIDPAGNSALSHIELLDYGQYCD